MATIILDRDGVIGVEPDGVPSVIAWQALPGSLPAIARLSQNGFRVVLAINQAELATRKFTIEEFHAINQKMMSHLSQYGGLIEAIFFCPCGSREQNCNCRKPKPDMLKDIASRLRINLAKVPYVGDRITDMQAARAAGAKPILVKTGRGAQIVKNDKVPKDVPVYEDLAAFVNELLGKI